MTGPEIHPIDCEQVHPSLFVTNLKNAIEFYTRKLSFTLDFTWGEPPTMAGVSVGRVQVFLEQVAAAVAPTPVYFVVGDVDGLYEMHRANGVAIPGPPKDMEYELREYEVRDPDGHTLFFGQHLMSREPKLAIERVDVSVRLEKRLVAVLADLAAHKRMTVGECLEETLLHTFDRLPGGGVPSPHTEGQLDRIQALKKQHGMDYDSHASYRFTEKR